MKKIILYFTSLLLIASSCNKSEVVPLFDESANSRVNTQINKYIGQLADAQFGWKGAYYPDGAEAGGYSFYLKFDKNGNLTMYSDVAAGFTDQAFETTYQVKALQKPTLIFDSYSYLHELVNPDYNGGDGEKADLELTIDSATDAKISLTGIKNKTELVLTKLSSTEYESVTKGGLANIFNSTVKYVTSDKFLNLKYPNGQNTDIFIDMNAKIFSIISIQGQDVSTKETAFITTTTGLLFKNPIAIFGVTIQELIWDNVAKSYYFLSGGNKFSVIESKRPALPFYYALGTLFTQVVFDTKIATQSAAYKTLYEEIKANTITLSTAAPVRALGDVYFQYLPDDGVFALVFDYTRTYADRVDAFGGVLFYEPSLDASGNITFGRLTDTGTLVDGVFYSGISPIVAAGVKKFTDVIENNAFSWDYDTVESKTAVLRAVKAPNFTVKGTLY